MPIRNDVHGADRAALPCTQGARRRAIPQGSYQMARSGRTISCNDDEPSRMIAHDTAWSEAARERSARSPEAPGFGRRRASPVAVLPALRPLAPVAGVAKETCSRHARRAPCGKGRVRQQWRYVLLRNMPNASGIVLPPCYFTMLLRGVSLVSETTLCARCAVSGRGGSGSIDFSRSSDRGCAWAPDHRRVLPALGLMRAS